MKKVVLLIAFIVAVMESNGQQRAVTLLDKNWRFTRDDNSVFRQSDFNDQYWETVTVPHDWAIKGPFGRELDAQTVMVTADGERKPALRTGRTGSLPWAGTGWYRKEIEISAREKGKKVFVEFDGAMSNAVVYLNGEEIGTWPYGYSSFSFELTDKVHFGKKNILAVRLENLEESSRWYPGAGIYRNVRLVITDPVHVKHWGTYVSTPEVNAKRAVVQIKTDILNSGDLNRKVVLHTVILDPKGKNVASLKSPAAKIGKEDSYSQTFIVNNPLLWDVENPYLYKAVTTVFVNNKQTDRYETSFGIRTIAFDNNKGFILNNRQVKIKGVCQHHDLGPLGAAVNHRALERQLEILKEMGVNAIRTSHNPPTPELLDLCDKMGFLVMDEAFDEWKNPKNKNGYNLLFDEWAEKDLRAMVKRDRNHPSIILWSIGNEVQEQSDSINGAKRAKYLIDIVHDEDPTRLVTTGFNRLGPAVKNGLAVVVDVVGFNYWPENYAKIHAQYPEWRLLGSETQSTISSRGEYMFPVEERKSHKYPNKQVSSYGLEFPNWGSAPDVEFAIQDESEYVAGQFVWTGFDYLGEPTPYNNDWPAHSSYFGLVDLAGIPKDLYYLYQSKWANRKVLHMLPHWNWPGREGLVTPVYVYTSYNSAELFVNGKSQGVQKKNPALKYGRFRLIWDNVIYQPGEIKVVAFDADGRIAEEKITRTAGEAAKIELIPDRKIIKADGKDLSFITVRVLDKDGNLCPDADNNLAFKVENNGFIRGVANGDATNIQSLGGSEMKAFHGQCVLVVQSTEKKGNIEVTAITAGLKDQVVLLTSE